MRLKRTSALGGDVFHWEQFVPIRTTYELWATYAVKGDMSFRATGVIGDGVRH